MSKIRVRNGVTEKWCVTCKIWKPLTDFSPGGKSHQRASPSCCSSRFRIAVIIVESLKTDFGSP
jgi:hypothetical protein